MKPIYIINAVRTPIGNYGGSLAHMSPGELGGFVISSILKKIGVSDIENNIDEIFLGNVLGAGHGMNVARQSCIRGGVGINTPSTTVNMVCGSGLKAVELGYHSIMSGQNNLVLVGGVESMSQAPYLSMQTRFGARMGHVELKDMMISDGLTDAFKGCHMGITAENIVERFGISRLEQDEFAAESQRKAVEAIKNGDFAAEIVSVPIIKKGKEEGRFEIDEFPRADSSCEKLGRLKPAFKTDGTVSAGNSSGINDGGAVLMLASEEGIKKFGLIPMARILGSASAGVEPEVMGIGPVKAVNKLCSALSITPNLFDLVEANEAFAAQAIAVNRSLEWDLNKVNVSGGAIALGHPIGASGARILVTLLHGMKRLNRNRGIATLCVGGGQGIALAVERC